MAYELSNLKILLVDDDSSMRFLVRDLLKAFGIGDVQTANDGQAAYQALRNFVADIVIADWVMKPMNGLEFLQKVRNEPDSPNPYVPMIMLTGYTDVDRVMACRNAGVTSYLAKPITPETLYKRIVSVIEDERPFVRTESYFGPDLGDATPTAVVSSNSDKEAVFEI